MGQEHMLGNNGLVRGYGGRIEVAEMDPHLSMEQKQNKRIVSTEQWQILVLGAQSQLPNTEGRGKKNYDKGDSGGRLQALWKWWPSNVVYQYYKL